MSAPRWPRALPKPNTHVIGRKKVRVSLEIRLRAGTCFALTLILVGGGESSYV